MRELGFKTFDVPAHDRGACVAQRMAMDHPDAVKRLITLDIAPTLAMYEQTNEAFVRECWHWFFLIRPASFRETLIEVDPGPYLRIMGARSAGMTQITDEALAEYLRCLSLPDAAYGVCEDYRARVGVDLEQDRDDLQAGKKLELPLLALWGAEGVVGRCFDPLGEWQKIATNVQSRAEQSRAEHRRQGITLPRKSQSCSWRR